MRPRFAAVVAACVALAAAGAAAAAPGPTATPVTRLPFPERGFVVDVPESVSASEIGVTENGRRVRRLEVTPLSSTDLRSGVVLAIDASESMAGRPFASALAAARAFVERRPSGQLVGIVAFNGDVDVLQPPTGSARAVSAALASPPPLRYGTRIYDGLLRAIELLDASKLSVGSIVVLSDGADLGSTGDVASVVAAASRHHVRIFSVGLRSGAYEASALRRVAAGTGGEYVEARSAGDLEAIYAALGRRFAREYLVQYRSDARAAEQVQVTISVDGTARVSSDYVAPTPAGVEPYHRSLLTRFLLSPLSVVALALFAAALVGWVLVRALRGQETGVVERVGAFAGAPSGQAQDGRAGEQVRRRDRYASGWWARVERELEVARIRMSARAVVGWTLAGTIGVVGVLALVSPVLALLGLLTPLVSRGVVRRKLSGIRNDFADQLPANLQVLASALRAGHGFTGALAVVVDNSHEPAQSELRRILRDDQFGVPPEEAIRSVAVRMENRDLEQVALLAELQRTAGGNAAEVLDTVVFTIRERGELRRLVRTLTAQGRMARWILTALPIGLAGALWLMHPDVMAMFFASTGGQVALVVAAVMVIAGSTLIQRIVDIDV